VREDSARSVGVKESFEDSGVKDQEEQCFHTREEAQKFIFCRRGKKAKFKAFGNLEFFQVHEESVQAQEGAQKLPDWQEKRDMDR
jgi:hypothetical protein